MVESGEENLNIGVAMEHTGKFNFPSTEETVQAHEIWRPSTISSLVN